MSHEHDWQPAGLVPIVVSQNALSGVIMNRMAVVAICSICGDHQSTWLRDPVEPAEYQPEAKRQFPSEAPR